MARKRRHITDADVDRWISQGYGQGEGDRFSPWMKVRDFPSRGRSTRIAGLKSARIHQLFSDVEAGHFIQAEFQPSIVEIREQVALLPRGDTQRIAAELGIRHPTYPGTRTKTVMTSDLWLAVGNGHAVRAVVLCVKRENTLQADRKGLARALDKLTIERQYWQQRGVEWRLVTEADFDEEVIRNLRLLRPSRRQWHDAETLERARQIARLVMRASNAKRPLDDLLGTRRWGLQKAYEAFGLAVWKHWIPADLHQAVRRNLPVPLLRQPSHALE